LIHSLLLSYAFANLIQNCTFETETYQLFDQWKNFSIGTCLEYSCEGNSSINASVSVIQPDCEALALNDCLPGYELIDAPQDKCCGSTCSPIPFDWFGFDNQLCMSYIPLDLDHYHCMKTCISLEDDCCGVTILNTSDINTISSFGNLSCWICDSTCIATSSILETTLYIKPQNASLYPTRFPSPRPTLFPSVAPTAFPTPSPTGSICDLADGNHDLSEDWSLVSDSSCWQSTQTFTNLDIDSCKFECMEDEGCCAFTFGGSLSNECKICADCSISMHMKNDNYNLYCRPKNATVIPTVEPTYDPTGKPSLKPTIFPTKEPTIKPTRRPTPPPTSRPTLPHPTWLPSLSPSKDRVCVFGQYSNTTCPSLSVSRIVFPPDGSMTRQELIEQCERECCFLDECHKFRINENSLGVYCVMMDASAPMNFNRPGAGTCYLKEYLSYASDVESPGVQPTFRSRAAKGHPFNYIALFILLRMIWI